MLAYNLSPSFNWDTTGMSDEEMRAFPRGARQARLRLQLHHLRRAPDRRARGRGVRHRPARRRDARARPPAAKAPPPRVAVPHAPDAGRRPAADAALMAASGRTAATKAMGNGLNPGPAPGADRGSAEAARRLARGVAEHHGMAGSRKVELRPHAAGRSSRAARRRCRREVLANVVFARSPTGADGPSCRCATRTPRRRCAEAPDDAAAALPAPSVRAGLGALPDADRGQPDQSPAHVGPRHLHARQRRDRPDHRRRG